MKSTMLNTSGPSIETPEALAQLRVLFRTARAAGPWWGEDGGRRRPAVAVASLVAVLGREGEWLVYARVIAAFRKLLGDTFAAQVHRLAAQRVEGRGPVKARAPREAIARVA